MKNEESAFKELLNHNEEDKAIAQEDFPKPRWMINNSVKDDVWTLARTGFPLSNEDRSGKTDSLSFHRLIAPGVYLTDSRYITLNKDIRNSILYLNLIGRITRPLRSRAILITATNLVLHANELRHKNNSPLIINLSEITIDDIKDYLLSFSVTQIEFDACLNIIHGSYTKKSDVDWEYIQTRLAVTTRKLKSIKHKVTTYLSKNYVPFRSLIWEKREHFQASLDNVHFSLDPKEKTISNTISQIESLYVAKRAQKYKFSHSAMTIFSSGHAVFKTMLEPQKTKLIPVDIALHSLSNSLSFVRRFGPGLREYASNLMSNEKRLISHYSYTRDTSTHLLKKLQDELFSTTNQPSSLIDLNIVSVRNLDYGKPFNKWKDGLTFAQAISLYCAAMWIILASFSAGRSTSLRSLRRDCFICSPIDGLFDLKIRIPKSSERFDLEEVYRPIPDIIHDYGLEFAALSCELEKWKSEITQDTEAYLFNQLLSARAVHSYSHTKRILYSALTPLGLDTANSYICFFQDWIDSPTKNGERWYPSTHQFRRLFAVLYFNFSHDLGLEELSWFMGHAHLDQTFHYAELSPTDEWLEEAKRTIARIASNLHKQINSDETIKEIVTNARAQTNVSTVLEELVHHMIEEHQKNTGQEVRFHRIDGEDIFFYFSNAQEEQ